MGFSYHGDPSDSDVDAVRFLLGDTDPDEYELEDEEISWTLTQESDVFFAAALCADSLATKFGSYPTSQTIGETSVTYGEQVAKYAAQAASLRNTRRQMAVEPYASGWSVSGKEGVEANSDREELVAKKTDIPDSNIPSS